MSAIAVLRLALQKALTVSLEPPAICAALANEIDILKRILGGTGSERPQRDLLREAVAYFRANGNLPSLGMARAVCFGAVERFSTSEPPLIEDGLAFSELLKNVDEYQPQPRQYRRCYRGLLHSYFAYDGESEATPAPGRRSWIALRDYLRDRSRAIQVDGGSQPGWAELVEAEPNLLTDDPVGKYAPDLLDGRREAVDQIRSTLEVGDTSWLMRKLVLSQIKAAIVEPYSKFQHRVSHLLALLDGHELLEDEGLTLILDRYADIATPELNAGLRDRAIQSWGNPWLQRNAPKWTRVKPAARRLVSNWLKLDLIRDFFEVLSEDRKTDKRRVKFWEQFHEQIDDMYFALGGATMYSSSPDVRKLRSRMADHLLELKKAGESSNNAFVMMMGGIVAVEFGIKGNACYLYDRAKLPFKLRGEVAGDRDGLRSHDNLNRLTHTDSSHGKWERKFSNELRRFGIALGQKPHIKRPASIAASSDGRASTQVDNGPPLNKRTFKEFVDRNQLLWHDNTSLRGNLSVKYEQRSTDLANQLRAWGFTFSDARRIWWRKDWP